MATNVTLHKNLPYNPLTDFIPVTLIAMAPEVLLVNAALPVRGIDDLVKLARATPGGLSFGSAGPELAQHLNGELLKAALGIEMQHIPYKGIQPALNDLASGHIALMSAPIPVALPLVQGGRVRMLRGHGEGARRGHSGRAVARRDRRARLRRAVLVHARRTGETPRAIVDKLHADLRTVLSEADVREEFILRQGLIPVSSPPPDEIKRFVEAEIVRLGNIVKKAGLAGTDRPSVFQG